MVIVTVRILLISEDGLDDNCNQIYKGPIGFDESFDNVLMSTLTYPKVAERKTGGPRHHVRLILVLRFISVNII